MKSIAKLVDMRIIHFGISGAVSTVVNICVLYFLTDSLHMWYLASAVISFLVAFCVSFGMQKYWTFESRSNDGVYRQSFLYFVAVSINLLINTVIVYAAVDYAGLHYLVAQIVASVMIAVESFFVYRAIFSGKIFGVYYHHEKKS